MADLKCDATSSELRGATEPPGPTQRTAGTAAETATLTGESLAHNYGVVASPSSAPPKERAKPPPRKRTRFHDELLEFLKEQAKREEERGRQAV
ncbi:hypothetical protein CRUP_012597, partial [Coryphaenoides rupestris]